ncbi:hypothetical protein GCM10009127_13730 [Alteraurantiacibacter aestuarii]
MAVCALPNGELATMRDRRAHREIADSPPQSEDGRIDKARIALALLGLAGAVAILAMNMQG